MTRGRKLAWCAALIAGVLSTASDCPRGGGGGANWISPETGRKHPVTFQIGNNVLVAQNNRSKFEVDQPISTVSGIVNARMATEVLATVFALNPVTGVKSLDVTVTDPATGQTLTAHADGTPNSSGLVPTSLLLIGTHAGYPDDKAFKISVVAEGKLVAKAVSFDGTVSEIELRYIPWGEVDASLQISPSQIPTGGQTEMAWNSGFAQTIVIDNGIGNVALPSGTLKFKPASTTTFQLTASNPFGSVQRSANVKVGTGGKLTITYKNPQAPPGNSPSNATFTYWGQLSIAPAAGDQGATTFSQTAAQTFPAGQAWTFTHQINDLATGPWLITVSAGSPQTGPVGSFVCNVTVPGSTTATQGALPNCQ